MRFKPVLNKVDAIKELTQKDNPFQRKKALCRSELLYLKYYIFSCKFLLANNKVEKSHVGVDVVSGECAHIKNINTNISSGQEIEFNQCITQALAKEKAQKFIISEILYRKKKLSLNLNIQIEFETMLEYPYWIGYFNRKNAIDFNVIDGITGQKQGSKMKAVFIKYLMQ